MAATLELTLDELAAWLHERGQALPRLSFRGAWPAVSLYLASEAMQCFHGGHSPDGVPWLPLVRPSAKRGGASAKPLRNTDHLMASVAAKGDGHLENGSDTSFVWGTNVSYAPYHQFGTGRIPARPFLGVNDRMLETIGAILAEHATRQVMGG
jgi:phage gpG-like protein